MGGRSPAGLSPPGAASQPALPALKGAGYGCIFPVPPLLSRLLAPGPFPRPAHPRAFQAPRLLCENSDLFTPRKSFAPSCF